MGYTHYWRHSHTIDTDTWTAITEDAKAIIAAAPNHGLVLRSLDGETGEPEVTGERVALNGDDDDASESFVMTRTGDGFSFCKTRRRPYDVIVTAVLCVVDHHTKSAVRVSSDGDEEEWEDGLRLAADVRAGIRMPISD